MFITLFFQLFILSRQNLRIFSIIPSIIIYELFFITKSFEFFWYYAEFLLLSIKKTKIYCVIIDFLLKYTKK